MQRFDFDEYGCLLALIAANRSEDVFTKTGCVALSKDGRVLGTAYNGLKSKSLMPSWMEEPELRSKKSLFFIHAESNLASFVKRGECHSLCLTMSPCIACCNIIAALDVKRVVFVKEYDKCDKYKEFLSFHSIYYKKLENCSVEKIKGYLNNLIKEL